MLDYIIYFYILLRWIIIAALFITMIAILIITVINRKWSRLIIVFLCPFMILSMFNIGRIRTSALEIQDLCENFDNIEQYICDCESLQCTIENEEVWALLYTEEAEYEFSAENVKNDIYSLNFSTVENAAEKAQKKVQTGKINDVYYYMTGMLADFSQETFYTYAGSYNGITVLQKNKKQIIINYCIKSNKSDPRIIFYCFRPNKILFSDYL